MKSRFKFYLVLVASVLVLGGCNQMPAGGSSAGIVIMDLAAIAKATGEDEVIRQEADAARADRALAVGVEYAVRARSAGGAGRAAAVRVGLVLVFH